MGIWSERQRLFLAGFQELVEVGRKVWCLLVLSMPSGGWVICSHKSSSAGRPSVYLTLVLDLSSSMLLPSSAPSRLALCRWAACKHCSAPASATLPSKEHPVLPQESTWVPLHPPHSGSVCVPQHLPATLSCPLFLLTLLAFLGSWISTVLSVVIVISVCREGQG